MIKLLLMKWFGLEDKPCETCEVLKHELEVLRIEKKELLDKILNPPTQNEPQPYKVPENLKPIMPRRIPWEIKRQSLEQEDRARAKVLKEQEQKIEKLEKEIGIEDATG